jgi:hypothetical protein
MRLGSSHFTRLPVQNWKVSSLADLFYLFLLSALFLSSHFLGSTALGDFLLWRLLFDLHIVLYEIDAFNRDAFFIIF